MKAKKFGIAVLLCAASLSVAQAADVLLEQGATLIQAGNAKAAYELLEPHEAKRAGDKDFDFLFALAALDSGQNTRAIFALERVLAVDPQHVRARAEIARAYLAVGETQAARTEFEAVKRQGVPGDVVRTVDNFLLAIDRLENAGKTTVRGYIEGVFGYDTNVNAGPSSSQITVFGGVPLTLNNTSRATGDFFYSIGGGANFNAPLNKQWAVVGGISGAQRLNHHRGDVDILNGDANIGSIYTVDKNTYSVSLQASTIAVDNNRFRESMGVTGQWQHNIDARNQVSLFGQYSDLRYIGQPVRDAERWTWGGGYVHATRDGMLGFVTAYIVEENVRNTVAAPYLGFDGYGVRFGGQKTLSPATTVFGNLGYEMRRHHQMDPLFLATRGDDQWTLNLGLSHLLKKDWKITGQYARTEQRSNTDINRYDRDVVSVAVRHEF